MKESETSAPEAGSTPSFEDAMQELSEIVATLEGGKAPLGKSLQLVQRGRQLSELCAQMLSEAELTLSQLAANADGELVEEELDWAEE